MVKIRDCCQVTQINSGTMSARFEIACTHHDIISKNDHDHDGEGEAHHQEDRQGLEQRAVPVSYTHLTLPTIYSV